MANRELEELLNNILPLAQQTLSKYGEFLPFGASMDLQDNIALATGYTGDEQPISQEVIELIVSGFRDQANKNKIKAVGVCMDVRITNSGASGKTDAICVRLEQSTGVALEVYLPYKKGKHGDISYEEMRVGIGKATVFR